MCWNLCNFMARSFFHLHSQMNLNFFYECFKSTEYLLSRIMLHQLFYQILSRLSSFIDKCCQLYFLVKNLTRPRYRIWRRWYKKMDFNLAVWIIKACSVIIFFWNYRKILNHSSDNFEYYKNTRKLKLYEMNDTN